MGKALPILLILLVGVGAAGFLGYSQAFDERLAAVREYASSHGKYVETQVPYSARLDSLVKLSQVLPIEIREDSWARFQEHYRIPACNPIYYDEAGKVLWVQHIVSGRYEIMYVYHLYSVQGFSEWASSYIEALAPQ